MFSNTQVDSFLNVSAKNRIPRKTPSVSLRVFNRDDGLRIGPVGNISLEGLMVFAMHELVVGRVYPLAMILPVKITNMASIGFDARCVWCRYSDEHLSYLAGFSFDSSDKKNQDVFQVLMSSSGR